MNAFNLVNSSKSFLRIYIQPSLPLSLSPPSLSYLYCPYTQVLKASPDHQVHPIKSSTMSLPSLSLPLLLVICLLASPCTCVHGPTSSLSRTTIRSGASLLPFCRRCTYDAECASCNCEKHRCVPRKGGKHFGCGKPLCTQCKSKYECACNSCIRNKCLVSSKFYFNCPRTRSRCTDCSYSSVCVGGKCWKDKCAKDIHDYYKCPGTLSFCSKCNASKQCRSGVCFKGKCVNKSGIQYYFQCPFTRGHCQKCTASRQCANSRKCIKGLCAKDGGEYLKCPGTAPFCASCTATRQCKTGLLCHGGKCINKKSRYFDCPFTRGKCQKCSGGRNSRQCVKSRRCIGGVCAKDSSEFDRCTKCCFHDRCSKSVKCIRKGGIYYNKCANKIFTYDRHSCKPSIFKCCYSDNCSKRNKCVAPGGTFSDACGAQYTVRPDCKLVKKKSEKVCCYGSHTKCFGKKKVCVRRGSILKDQCGGSYDVDRKCHLKRKVCCYKASCGLRTYCKVVGQIVKTRCGARYKVTAGCKMQLLHRQLIVPGLTTSDKMTQEDTLTLMDIPHRLSVL